MKKTLLILISLFVLIFVISCNYQDSEPLTDKPLINISEGNKTENITEENKTNIIEEAKKYAISPKNHSLIFTRNLLIGKREKINFTTYSGVNDYLADLERAIWYTPGVDPEPTDIDFVLKRINNPIQDFYLKTLAIKIKNITSDKDEQARIAISVVQMIKYDENAEIINDDSTIFVPIPFSPKKARKIYYPYEVIYNEKGLCGEKSELIIYLLRELGFGTAYLSFEEEQHAAVGIKCPVAYSYKDTGYCFVEATDKTIIGQSNNLYVDVGKLSYTPKIYAISEGIEYKDIIQQIENAKLEIKNNTRFEIRDESGAIIARINGDAIDRINYPDVIIKYPD